MLEFLAYVCSFLPYHDNLVRLWTIILHWFADVAQITVTHIAIEGFLVCGLVYVLMANRRHKRNHHKSTVRLTREEEDQLLAEWKPKPLVPEDFDPDTPENRRMIDRPVVKGKCGLYIEINGTKCLNFATHNYLGFITNEAVEDEAVKCLKKFGVGSCGPRAFLGTADIHVHLEQKLASFMKAEQAVIYSYGFSTMASAIPAYAKKGDIIFADECVNFALQKGMDASRSKIIYFKHNDVSHLQSLLEAQSHEDKKNPKLAKISRRFLVVEGIYANTGQLVPLPSLVVLKHQYKLRLFIDESISFGTIGRTGRGVIEHFNLFGSPEDGGMSRDVDMVMASLEHAIGSIGGFCAGSTHVIEHHTLAGLGYCFSASLPPLLAAGAFKALELMEGDDNHEMFKDLHVKCCKMHSLLQSTDFIGLELRENQYELAPIKHLVFKSDFVKSKSRSQLKQIVWKIIDQARDEGLAVVMASYLDESEVNLPPVSIRITVSTLLSHALIDDGVAILKNVCSSVFKNCA